MQLGMVGSGRMGASLVRRLLNRGCACVVHDMQPAVLSALAKYGAMGAAWLKEMVSRLGQPQTLWLMVPAGVVDRELDDLVPLLDAGDIVIDGGNSHYRDDMRPGVHLQACGIHYLDVGASGGVAGLERGYCLMIGGEGGVVEHCGRSFRRWRRASKLQHKLPAARQGRARPRKAYATAVRMGQGTWSSWSITALSTA